MPDGAGEQMLPQELASYTTEAGVRLVVLNAEQNYVLKTQDPKTGVFTTVAALTDGDLDELYMMFEHI